MKLTQKIEAEVLKVYEAWLHSYLHGDVETYNSFLDDEYHFIGSTNNEEFLNRKDTTQFFEDTGDQFAGKTEIRNESKTIEQFGELIFITHVFDGWFLHEKEWNFYSRFRFSSTLRKNKEGWRFIFQHFSIPDAKTAEGETIGYDKINEENQELREAIQRRTIELEQKNRELEIEGALERIRAQAVAMKETSDLLDIVVSMRNEFIKLGHEAHYFWHMMWLPEIYEKAMTSGDGTKIGFVMKLPRHIHGDIPQLAKWEKSKKQTVVYAMNVDEALNYVHKMVTLGDFQNIDPQAPSEDDIRHIGGLTFIMARTTHGEIGYSLPGVVKNPPKEDIDILVKFAGAFDLAHRRFLDLQKAEKQAREVQIELALEKVRSRSMAMHTSEELTEAGALLYQELSKLGIQHLSTAYTLFDEKAIMGWSYGVDPMDGSIRHKPVGMDHTKNKVMKAIAESWKKQEPLLVLQLNEKETIKHQMFIAEECIGFPLSAEKLLSISPERLVIHTFNFKQGYLLIVGGVVLAVEQQEMITRFANVFQQTYTRFLDLQNAEAQTRENHIELALERVRSRSMAMQKSEELKEVIQIVYDQFINLNINIEHTGFIIDYKKNDAMHIWLADKNEVAREVVLPYFDCAHWNSFKEAKAKGKGFFANQLSLKEKNKFYKDLFKLIPDVQEGLLEIYLTYPGLAISTVLLETVGLYIENFDGIPYSEKENEILMRFGKVFQQTYTRFLDLQKAEESARKSQIDVSLERVRARAMAMHQSNELSEAAELLYQEFYKLGVTPFSCGYLINDDEKNHWKVWMTDANDESFKDFWTLPFNADHHLKSRYESWKNKESFHVSLLEGEENRKHHKVIAQYAPWKVDSMGDLPDRLVLNSAHFTHGHLLIVTGELLTPEVESILTRFATVFDQTYIRFLDLKKAEHQALLIKEEKERLEKTLSDLQATQKQLIQSEKMASLGELTAGIAHEIQNPLNFVNNFSEVSNELIDEIDEELANGDMEEVKAILNDIKQNLVKINHHGKRADAIVKGMLQHSRKSTAEKVPTDINKLADEYLRLAYHGLRAKDKSFNATLETDFDETIDLVNVIPQDMGRVILNLFTNAFYATNEREKASEDKNFKPTVSVSTKKLKDTVTISVKDNGNGIPKHIVDKIFQPFFTTKPTGEGTGLGLSMSYDIIKAHGGELKVETKDGEGTTFIILISTTK